MNITIDLEEFAFNFSTMYSFLCRRNNSHVVGFKEAVAAFDEFAEKHTAFVCKFIDHRGDAITSDCEAAAFMLTLMRFDPSALKIYTFE